MKIHKTSFENNEKQENVRSPLENHENHEKLKFI